MLMLIDIIERFSKHGSGDHSYGTVGHGARAEKTPSILPGMRFCIREGRDTGLIEIKGWERRIRARMIHGRRRKRTHWKNATIGL